MEEVISFNNSSLDIFVPTSVPPFINYISVAVFDISYKSALKLLDNIPIVCNTKCFLV
jgi:hypothetical protein